MGNNEEADQKMKRRVGKLAYLKAKEREQDKNKAQRTNGK